MPNLPRSAGRPRRYIPILEDVESRARHVIVNIGDRMSLLTNRPLHSSLHCVAPPHDRLCQLDIRSPSYSRQRNKRL
ncbi:hypothetical protein LOCC1_G002463 [Lachnellula occidentalis]|uniref:Uncharacterized protein n=1 Tax=Lachnellula occidentalis TaxID=215460 RepID=A0A8H8UK45_9HELO|nr:hypothetical protein LOCC1_G002463 [Lachnellula occidentalis]